MPGERWEQQALPSFPGYYATRDRISNGQVSILDEDDVVYASPIGNVDSIERAVKLAEEYMRRGDLRAQPIQGRMTVKEALDGGLVDPSEVDGVDPDTILIIR